MGKYILSIDQGTSSTRALLFDKNSNIINSAQKNVSQTYPKPGYVEQDPFDIWKSVLSVIDDCMLKKGINPADVDSIGITNQRETTIIWNKITGEPIHNAIVWLSKQTTSICEELKDKGYKELIKKKTGLIIDPYFSASKIKWILDNVEGAYDLALKGDLLFGTVDTWLVWKLSGGKLHITDYSNASRTMLFNIHNLKWDKEILDILNIPESMLPKVYDSSNIYGYTAAYTFYGNKIPIAGIAGDQQSALFGQLCLNIGDVKNTYGTGCFLLMNTGNKVVNSNRGLLSTIAWGINGKITYAIEGSVFVAGAAINWLRDNLEFFEDSNETSKIAEDILDNNGVFFVPAFVGLGTPYWDSECRGSIYGICSSTKKEHIVRACLESLAFQTKDLITVMEEDSNIGLKDLKVDGGISINDFLMQFQADLLKTNVIRPMINETTALGAAYLAGLATGFFEDIDLLKKVNRKNKIYNPNTKNNITEKLYEKWKLAVEITMKFK